MSGEPMSDLTTADKVALLAIELGLAPEPWQFDWLARIYDQEAER